MIKFTEEKLEQAVIELFEAEGCKHLNSGHVHKEIADALNCKKDLSAFAYACL